MMKILMVMAHPDDETIFGYPIIQYKQHDVSLLTLSHNKERHGDGPVTALKEVCNVNDVRLIDCERIANNFYRMPPRFTAVTLPDVILRISISLKTAIKSVRPDAIFTHNPMGEYGHGDHRFVFNMVSMFKDNVPLMLTDICLFNRCHLSSHQMPKIYLERLYASKGETFALNKDWYTSMKKVYERHRAWSWSGHEPVLKCKLYTF